jgi:hypothetical protein
VLHAQRPEQTVLKNFYQGRAFKFFGDEPEQGIVGVAIVVFLAGREDGRTLKGDGEQFLRCPNPGRVVIEALPEFRRCSVVIRVS